MCDNYSLRFSYVGYDQLIRTDVIVRSKRISYVNVELNTSVMETEAITVNAGYFTNTEEQPTSNANFTSEEIDGFYYGFSNRSIWPLFHYFMEYTEWDANHWKIYKKVNKIIDERFESKISDRKLRIQEGTIGF